MDVVAEQSNSAAPQALSTPARLLGALPMFLFFLLICNTCWMVPRFEQIFKEMDLGNLPLITNLVLLLSNSIQNFPYLFMPVMFGIAWIFFAWGCKTRQRMLWFAWVMAMLDIGVWYGTWMAMYMPMFDIMNKIGK